MTDRIGELLLRERLITPEQLKKAIDEQKKSGGRLGFNLAKLGYITEKDLTSFLSRQYGIPTIDLSVQEVDHEIVKLIPEDVAQKYQVIPVSRTGSTLVVAMADPSNIFAIDDIKFLTGYNVEPLVASDSAVKSAIEKYYESTDMGLEGVLTEFDEGEMEVIKDEEEVDLSDLKKAVEDAPVVKLVNLILTDAIKKEIDRALKDFRDVFQVTEK